MTKQYKSETNACNNDENALKHELKQCNFHPILTPLLQFTLSPHNFNFLTLPGVLIFIIPILGVQEWVFM